MAKLELRYEVVPDDVQAVGALVAQTGFFNDQEVEVAAELVQTRLQQGDSSGYFFIFGEIQKRLAGYVCYGPVPGTRCSFDLYWIVVAPEHQNQGIGKQLVQACEREIIHLGGGRIFVETAGRAQYQPTRTFYERLGYLQVAHLPEFYAPGDAKIIYEKVVCGEGRSV